MRILLVEDEENISKLIKLNLEMEGYEVVASGNGKEALRMVEQQHFDLLVLDIMLPEVSGYQICEKVRLANSEVGIIIISAKDASADRIKGLKLGADDYLSKPFNLEELLLRIDKVLSLRNKKEDPATVDEYSFGKNHVNFSTYMAQGNLGEFRLTRKEVLLLKMLVERVGEVVSRQQILQNVWGYDVYPSTRTIDNFILNFRKYFEENPKEPKFFESVRGVGYRFVNNG
jgi:two-component system alkaline phosphatase synthesis response regulator PhoP